MVSGNPPRHSKDTEEPVTLDLDAKDFSSTKEKETDQDKSASESPKPHPETMFEPLETGPDKSEKPEAQAAAPAEEDERLSTEGNQEPVSEPTPSMTTAEARPQATTSKLIAAGILGGLIALLASTAIQYAMPSRQAQDDERIAQISAEIEGLKQTVSNIAAAPGGAGNEAIEKRLAALEASKGSTEASPADDQKIASLSQEIAQLRSTLTQTSEQQSKADNDVSSRLDAAEKKLNEPRQDVAVAKAVAAAALKGAIDRGGNFTAELETYGKIAPDDETVAQLKPFAESGVPSRAELMRQVPDVATAMVEAANRPDPNAEWWTRLTASAKSLVKVRPVGAVEGDSVEAIAARFEDKVKNGELQGASGEWAHLPDVAKQASAAFEKSLEARTRVEDLVGSTLSKAISQTGKEG
ncbi:hypothetical protein [Oryzifoliimicrobium ureilyticus]|uniref:hypothetical protein n=1 Tax=Oryzifoliimicrobium ureilyticus TaxID=3113724 RepID=UPI003076706C